MSAQTDNSEDVLPSAQDEFDANYITSGEVCRRAQLTRGGLTHCLRYAKELPDPVEVRDRSGGRVVLLIWPRHAVEPWLAAREQRRAA